MRTMIKSAERFWLVGNRVAVDFANTVVDRRGRDGLSDWPDAVDFLLATQLVDHREAERLHHIPEADPRRAVTALRLAHELRGSVRELLSGIEGRKGLQHEAIERINAVMRMGHGHDVVVRDGPHWTVRFVRIEAGPATSLVPIARSIAEIVADSRAPEAVRKCANGGCALYFYDTSRTGQRRWCSMASCGNRAKVAAHVRRTRG
jgi:predicted RNA-binding Zn ribbon-like protein